MTWRARWPVRVALAVAVSWLLVGAGATPVAAHTVGGAQASNYQTRIRAIEPAVAGLRVEVVDAGTRLRLRNPTGLEVVVLGYAGEPYLRVGPAGVFENRRSPATYRNRVRIAPAPPRPTPIRPRHRSGGAWTEVTRWPGTTTGRTGWRPATHRRSELHPAAAMSSSRPGRSTCASAGSRCG